MFVLSFSVVVGAGSGGCSIGDSHIYADVCSLMCFCLGISRKDSIEFLVGVRDFPGSNPHFSSSFFLFIFLLASDLVFIHEATFLVCSLLVMLSSLRLNGYRTSIRDKFTLQVRTGKSGSCAVA